LSAVKAAGTLDLVAIASGSTTKHIPLPSSVLSAPPLCHDNHSSFPPNGGIASAYPLIYESGIELGQMYAFISVGRSAMREFSVEGAGEFPITMLNVDMCWPKTLADARAIMVPTSNASEARQIRLINLISYSPSGPSRRRWRSYNWWVID